MKNIATEIKYKIIWLWLTRIFLRRIGKRFPEFFKEYIYDITDNRTARKIMLMRYTGESQMKFEAIALELNTDVRNVFSYHKKVLDRIISL